MEQKKKHPKMILYDEETEKLINSEKTNFIQNLKDISQKVENYESVEKFLEEIPEQDELKLPEINSKQNEFLIWFNMKILGVVFMTLYITGVYIFIGFKDSIFEEIKASATLYLFNTTRNEDETFYDIYEQISQEPPDYGLYFLTSSFANCCFGCMNIYWQTFIVLVINAAIFIGIYNFDFHIYTENININYSIWEFLYLVLMYVILYASIGLISALPHNIFDSAFEQYEEWNNKRKKNNNNNNNDNNDDNNDNNTNINSNNDNNKINNLNNDNNINNNNNNNNKSNNNDNKNNNYNNGKNNDNNDNEEKKRKTYNGYFLGYFISILVSMAFKYILNRFIIVQENGKIRKFYAALIACHCIPILLGLLVYLFFSKIFDKNIVEQKKKKDKYSGCRILGYVYYHEKKPNPVDIKCEGCRKGFRKCYFNCSCYKFPCFGCCECKKCCCCCGEEDNLSEVDNKDKEIYVIYKSTGLCSWFCDLVTNNTLLLFAIIMFFLELINFGFKPGLSNFLEDMDKTKIFIVNLLNLAGILLFYFIDLVSGILFKKFFNIKNDKGEGDDIGYGLSILIFTGSIFSCIISIFSYFTNISENAKHYLMPFSTGSIEFYNILLEKIADAVFKTQAISFESFFSIYVTIWSIIPFMIEIFEVKNSKLILTQFIITLIIVIPGIILIICTIINPDAIKHATAGINKGEESNNIPRNQTERTNIQKDVDNTKEIKIYNQN